MWNKQDDSGGNTRNDNITRCISVKPLNNVSTILDPGVNGIQFHSLLAITATVEQKNIIQGTVYSEWGYKWKPAHTHYFLEEWFSQSVHFDLCKFILVPKVQKEISTPTENTPNGVIYSVSAWRNIYSLTDGDMLRISPRLTQVVYKTSNLWIMKLQADCMSMFRYIHSSLFLNPLPTIRNSQKI